MNLAVLYSWLSVFVISVVEAKLRSRGVDFSSLWIQERAGTKYKDVDGRPMPLEWILSKHGVNSARFRLFVNPANGLYNMQYTLGLAKRAKKAGMTIYIDLHLADSWADPAHQRMPFKWRVNSLDDAARTLEEYTRYVGNTFAAAGAPIDFISLGNEIRYGLLWPYGRRSIGVPAYGLSRILKAGINGVRNSGSRWAKIIVQLDSNDKWVLTDDFFTTLFAPAFKTRSPIYTYPADINIVGYSFYPHLGQAVTITSMRDILVRFQAKYGRFIQQAIVETDWPAYCTIRAKGGFPKELSYIPFSAPGQYVFFQQLARLPFVTDMWVWEIGWLANSGLVSGCEDALMFQQNGVARTSVSIFSAI